MKSFIVRNPVRNFALVVSAGAAIGAPLTMVNEGVRLKPYYDSVGVLTWCVGETQEGYQEEFTNQECSELFKASYGYYSTRTSFFYNDTGKAHLTPEIHAAFTDMSYNVGLGTVKRSSMIRHLNAGEPEKACHAILKYKYAGGQDCSAPGNRTCRGVWKRRLQMHELCLKGVSDDNI